MLLLRLLPLLILFLLPAPHCLGFQSDELDDEEWGITAPVMEDPSSRSAAAAAMEAGKVEFALEHAFGSSSDFSPAGTFTARLRPSFRGGQALVKLRLTRNPFSQAEKEAFKELVEKDEFYSIRVPAVPLASGKAYVISSTKARCLAAGDMKERIDIYMDQGSIIAVGYTAGVDCPFPRPLKYPSKWSFDTHLVSKGGEQAARTLLLNDLLEPGSDDKLVEDNPAMKKPEPEKSFWAKYWMYIIPLGLIVMNAITQVANLQEEQGAAAPRRR